MVEDKVVGEVAGEVVGEVAGEVVGEVAVEDEAVGQEGIGVDLSPVLSAGRRLPRAPTSPQLLLLSPPLLAHIWCSLATLSL